MINNILKFMNKYNLYIIAYVTLIICLVLKANKLWLIGWPVTWILYESIVYIIKKVIK